MSSDGEVNALSLMDNAIERTKVSEEESHRMDDASAI